MRHRGPVLMFITFLRFWETDVPLASVAMFPLVATQRKHGEANSYASSYEQLQCLGHARLLSTMMPQNRNTTPTSITPKKVYQLGWEGSKSSYRGPKTIMSVPASRSESPIISAVNLWFGKVTSVHREESPYLSSLGQLLVFQTVRRQQTEHGITEQERVLAIVKPPRHFVEVRWEMLPRITGASSFLSR